MAKLSSGNFEILMRWRRLYVAGLRMSRAVSEERNKAHPKIIANTRDKGNRPARAPAGPETLRPWDVSYDRTKDPRYMKR